MIDYLSGQVILKRQNHIVVAVNGVGYGLEVPYTLLSRISHLSSSDNIVLWVYTYVKEDALKLYGFSSYEEKSVFATLIGLSGVGPKLALSILSTFSLRQLSAAVAQDQPQVFESIPGVGKRTGEKLLVELKPKLKKLMETAAYQEAFSNKQNPLDEQSADEVIVLGRQVSIAQGLEQTELLRSELSSALENLGYKEKQFRLLVEEGLNHHSGTENFASILQKILTRLSGSKVLVDRSSAEGEYSNDLLQTF